MHDQPTINGWLVCRSPPLSWSPVGNYIRIVVCFLLGNSPASEFYMPTFRNTLSVPFSYVGRYEEWLGLRMLGYWNGERFGPSQTFCHINTPTFSNLVILHTYPPMKMEQTECSETWAHKIQMVGNYPEESIQYSEHGESLKSSMLRLLYSGIYHCVVRLTGRCSCSWVDLPWRCREQVPPKCGLNLPNYTVSVTLIVRSHAIKL
jgi:hypothetical protein